RRRRAIPSLAAQLGRAGADVDYAGLGQRHSVHRSAGAALARRRLPRLSAPHQHAHPLVSEKRVMNEIASAAASVAESSHGLIGLAERGWLPDTLIRLGIRRLCAQRLREEAAGNAETAWSRFRQRLDELRESPVAIHTDAANAQHYELPARFFELCL